MVKFLLVKPMIRPQSELLAERTLRGSLHHQIASKSKGVTFAEMVTFGNASHVYVSENKCTCSATCLICRSFVMPSYIACKDNIPKTNCVMLSCCSPVFKVVAVISFNCDEASSLIAQIYIVQFYNPTWLLLLHWRHLHILARTRLCRNTCCARQPFSICSSTLFSLSFLDDSQSVF